MNYRESFLILVVYILQCTPKGHGQSDSMQVSAQSRKATSFIKKTFKLVSKV
jgi:hypothetical protein